MISESEANFGDSTIGYMTGQIFGQQFNANNFTYGTMMSVLNADGGQVLVSNFTGIHFQHDENDDCLQAYVSSICNILDGDSNSLVSWDAVIAALYQDHDFIVFAKEDPLEADAIVNNVLWLSANDVLDNPSTKMFDHVSLTLQQKKQTTSKLQSVFTNDHEVMDYDGQFFLGVHGNVHGSSSDW